MEQNTEQIRNSVELYHCSVFSYGTTEQFRFCTTVPFLHYCSVFIPLFRFFFHKEQRNKTEQCGIVSLFLFFHKEQRNKNRTIGIVSLFRFFLMELRNSFVFAPLLRFCITVPFLTLFRFCITVTFL